MKNNDIKKVAVALSGGLDSSVATFLLKQQGYEVVTITAKMLEDENFDQVVQNAKSVADYLGVEHHVIDLSYAFKKNVIEYFENTYSHASTPNPCIVCNKTIKWGALLDYATQNLGISHIATGHYANIKQENDIYKLFPACDSKKDQLYYLFELSQAQLSKTLFPIAHLEKNEVRQIALENNLPSKSSKESQDICFIKKPMTAKKYLEQRFSEQPGDFILKSTGEKLGIHQGFFKYTIGQRKGIGIAYKVPLYVVEINASNNTVYLGEEEALLNTKVTATNLNFCYPFQKDKFEANVKIRYNSPAQKALVSCKEDSLIIDFHNPVSAPAKGQAAVLYDLEDGHLIGGGWIN